MPAQCQTASGEDHIAVESNSENWGDLTPEREKRREIYGGPIHPLPRHREMDEFLAQRTRSFRKANLQRAYYHAKVLEVNECMKKKQAERLDHIRESPAVENVRLPFFWASHAKIKTRLGIAQEGDALRVVRALSQQEPASASAKMLTNWALDPGKEKKSFASSSRIDRCKPPLRTWSHPIQGFQVRGAQARKVPKVWGCRLMRPLCGLLRTKAGPHPKWKTVAGEH